MKIATRVKAIEDVNEMVTAQALYKLSVPVEDSDGDQHEYVIVSAANVLGRPETYIFPANESGEIVSWSELDGSYSGGRDHAKALADAGYELAP